MFGKKSTIRQAMAAVDADIAASVTDLGHALNEFADDIPLKGLSVENMLAIEKRGLELCRARLADIETEMARLSNEHSNTAAILGAALGKVKSLEQFVSPAQAAPKPETPPAVHKDIRTDRKPALPVAAPMAEAQTLELDDAEAGVQPVGQPQDKKG